MGRQLLQSGETNTKTFTNSSYSYSSSSSSSSASFSSASSFPLFFLHFLLRFTVQCHLQSDARDIPGCPGCPFRYAPVNGALGVEPKPAQPLGKLGTCLGPRAQRGLAVWRNKPIS